MKHRISHTTGRCNLCDKRFADIVKEASFECLKDTNVTEFSPPRPAPRLAWVNPEKTP